MRSIFTLSSMVATLTVVTTSVAADLELVLLHANDMHSRFDETDVYCNECREDDAALGKCYGGLARVAQIVRDEKRMAAERGVPSLFMVAGDTFQGTPYFSLFKWKPVVDFIKELNPDVMTLGNHEFDAGVDTLVSYLNGIQGIPTVISNLNMTAEPELNNLVIPSLVLTINNTKVGVVGYLTPETMFTSHVGAVNIFDEVKSLKKETKKLRENGVNIIIGLGHSGIEMDQIIAREVEDIDLIVGGHSHTLLYSGSPPSIEKPYGPYPLYVTNTNNKVVPILQVYAHTKYVGKVNLRFDANGDLVNIDGSPTLLDHRIEQDPSMLAVLDQWKPKVVTFTNITIGRTFVELINYGCYSTECNIGNLIADSFVHFNIMKKNVYDDKWTDAPIAIIQAGGIRSSINETDHDGYISLGQLITVQPFMNTLTKITITGSSLLEAFEYSVYNFTVHSNGYRGSKNFLQVSGIRVEFDLTQTPGNRVSSLLVRCADCRIPEYEPLVLTANYTIIMTNYLAEGGDNFTSFKDRVKQMEIYDVEDYNATASYVNAISPVITGIENRINFKSGAGKMARYSPLLTTIAFSAGAVLFKYTVS